MQGNEYRKAMPTINMNKLCSYLETEQFSYRNVVNASNFPLQGPHMCPFKPMFYRVRNMELGMTENNIPMPYNVTKVKVYCHIFISRSPNIHETLCKVSFYMINN